MRCAALALVVALALSMLASASPISEIDAVNAARGLIARVGGYSLRHPEAPGGCAPWAGREVTPHEPLLVHTYPDLAPSCYYVPLESGHEPTFVTVDASTGGWQAFGRRREAGEFPRVSRESAALTAAGALGRSVSPQELRAVGMPDHHVYWHAGEPGGREVFVNTADPADVHLGLDDDISPPQPDYDAPIAPSGAPRGSAGEPGAGARGAPRDYPDSYDIEGVPYHVQQGAYDCGPAAAEMVMDYWGADIDQQDIADVANCIYGSGSYNSDIRRAGHFSAISTAIQNGSLAGYDERKLGYAALDQWWSLDSPSDPDFPDRHNDLKTLVSQDYPLLLLTLYNTGGYGHFRVVKGYNDSTDVYIVHDPWYSDPYQGPDVNFNQTFFVDTLWAGIASRWATLIRPWEVEVSAPTDVVWGSTFTVTAIVTYHGPHPFESQDSASSREVEIDTSPLFSLAPGETALQTLPGSAGSGIGNLVTWDVVADTAELGNVISVTARGLISDSSWSYPSYSDSIGGWGSQGVTIWDPSHIFVDWEGSGDFTDIQSALNAANYGDTITVLPGTYSGPDNTDLDLLGKHVYLMGTAGATPAASTIIDCEGTTRGFHLDSGETPSTLIEGFIIRDGHAPGSSWPDDCGGGMFLSGSSPTIRDVRFEGCVAGNAGGGLACLGASPVVEDCAFLGNFASGSGGGGVLCYGESNPEFRECSFAYNEGQNQGGGIWAYLGASPTIEDCYFSANLTNFDGGAIALWESPSAVVTGCSILENSGGNVGGISFIESPAQITNTLIAYSHDGSAAGCSGPAGFEPSFQYCCVYGNALGDSLCGFYQGQGNMWVDPLMCYDDFGPPMPPLWQGLQECSPCLGGGLGGANIGVDQVMCPCGDPTGTDDAVPTALWLHPPCPSPSGGSTTLTLDVPANTGRVLLAIYSVAGRRVRTLVNHEIEPGVRQFVWDGTDDAGRPVSAGVYFARCACDAGTNVRKLVRLH